MSYYARVLCIRMSFSFLMYSAHDSSLIETHVLALAGVGGENAQSGNEIRTILMIHVFSCITECHMVHFACRSFSYCLGLSSLAFTTVPLCCFILHTHVFHLRDNISFAAFDVVFFCVVSSFRGEISSFRAINTLELNVSDVGRRVEGNSSYTTT